MLALQFSTEDEAHCPEEACLEEDVGGEVLTGQALERKRRRTILSQDLEEAEGEHVPTLQAFSHVSRSFGMLEALLCPAF